MYSHLLPDAAKRKALPAWIREGLEKMEREKSKKEEQERLKKEREEQEKQQQLERQKAEEEAARTGIPLKSKFVSLREPLIQGYQPGLHVGLPQGHSSVI